jgi:hypothetical protein
MSKSQTKNAPKKPEMTEDQSKLLGGHSIFMLRNFDTLDKEMFIKMSLRVSESLNRQLSGAFFDWWILDCETLNYVQKLPKEMNGYDYDLWKITGVIR